MGSPATVEGATRASAHFLPTLGEPIGRAVSRARDMIGDEFEVAAVRGAAMTDEELAAYVCTVAARL